MFSCGGVPGQYVIMLQVVPASPTHLSDTADFKWKIGTFCKKLRSHFQTCLCVGPLPLQILRCFTIMFCLQCHDWWKFCTSLVYCYLLFPFTFRIPTVSSLCCPFHCLKTCICLVALLGDCSFLVLCCMFPPYPVLIPIYVIHVLPPALTSLFFENVFLGSPVKLHQVKACLTCFKTCH